jgi:DNA-binding FrmR family transcriptional regulator
MAAREGQLDEISQAIGRLSGQMEAIERYMHEREHGLNNLVQKVEALGVRITRDIAAVEGRIEGRMMAMDARVRSLEDEKQRRDGAVGLVAWFAKHWPFSIVIAFLAAWIAWANGRLHL